MKWPVSVLACILALGTGAYTARPMDFKRGALKQVVDTCALSKRTVGIAFPCLDVQPGNPEAVGYAVVRGPLQKTEVLVVPTDPVTGIEDSALLSARMAALWGEAWRSRQFVFDMLGRTLPRDAIGLAVNSVQSRTQDQLHIHVDCVSPAVRQALAAKGSLISTNWRPFPMEMGDQIYWAKVVSSADLSHVNVAVLMRQGLPRTGRAMGRFTVAAIGTTMPDGKDGFFLFANSANAAAESLLDHSCRGV